MKWLVVGLFVALPLQWFGLGATPFGEARLHQLAIFVFALAVLVRYRLRAYSPVLQVTTVFLSATFVLDASWAVASMYQGSKPLGSIQDVLFIVSFVAVATYFYRAAAGKETGAISVLRWALPIVCSSLILGFALAMVKNGVNPAVVLAKTVATGNPELFQKEVFKSSFQNFGLDPSAVEGNLRHEIFGSLLFSMYVSAWAMRRGGVVTKAQRLAYSTAMVVGVVLLALSLSRSVLIAAIIWPVIAFWRSVLMGRVSTRQLAIVLAGLLGVAALGFSGFGLVIYNRFTTDTTGYGARAVHYENAFSAFRDHWLIGGAVTGGSNGSSHNFILDNWIRGGLLAGMAAVVVVGVTLLTMTRLLARLQTLPESMVPVAAALALPLVRMGTSGGGLITPVSWMVLAFVFGLLASRRATAPESVQTRRVTVGTPT